LAHDGVVFQAFVHMIEALLQALDFGFQQVAKILKAPIHRIAKIVDAPVLEEDSGAGNRQR